MKKNFLIIIVISLAVGSVSAQNFTTKILFTPGNNPDQSYSRIFAGNSTSSDGFDANDMVGPPPGQTHYVYFDLGTFPTYLWTDSRAWTSPYDSDKAWTIIITNASDITTTITWHPDSLPSILGRKFILTGISGEPIDMKSTNSASVIGNKTVSINFTANNSSVNKSDWTAPIEFKLSQNYPNPFNPETTISYQLSASSDVKLTIYNTLGHKIRTLVNTNQNADYYTVQWDGRNDSGDLVSSGIYFYTIKVGESTLIAKRMLMMK